MFYFPPPKKNDVGEAATYVMNLASLLVEMIERDGTHLKLRGQNIDPLMGTISFNPYRGQINHDLGHFLQHQNNPEKGRF